MGKKKILVPEENFSRIRGLERRLDRVNLIVVKL